MAPPGYVTCQPLNTTSEQITDLGKDDLNALLYIVITLLFYSMGIIIGIITYLKREQAEMEEDKMFDLYLSLKREPFNLYKKERVNQMAIYLKQMEEARQAREKIEIWNTEQQQLRASTKSHSSTGAEHNLSQGERSGAASPRLAFTKDGTPLVMPPTDSSDFPESRSGGASALLCSYTLGVCEPLLTPESAKARLVYPSNQPATLESTISESSANGTMVSRSPFNQRHSAPSLNSARSSLKPNYDTDCDSPTTIPYDGISAHASDINLPRKVNQDGSSSRDSDALLQDLRLFNFNLTRAMLLQNSESKSSETCNASHEIPSSSPGPCSSSSSPARTESVDNGAYAPRRLSLLQRQMSLDAERNVASSADTYQKDKASSARENIIEEEASSFPFSGDKPSPPSYRECSTANVGASQSSPSPPPPQSASSYSPLKLCPSPDSCSSVSDPMQNEKVKRLKTQSSVPFAKTLDGKESVVADPQRLGDEAKSFPSTADVRPKVHDKSSSKGIPRSISSGHSKDTDKKRLHSPFYESWRHRAAKTVDIPDSSRSIHGGTDAYSGRRKNNDKRITSRPPARDNERRGALMYAQKSLHHIENDSPKTGAGGQGRRGQLGHQESVDSYSSRNTDVSDLADSPLLHPAFGKGSALPPDAAGGSPPHVKQSRRAPRIARSQTVDASKTHHL